MHLVQTSRVFRPKGDAPSQCSPLDVAESLLRFQGGSSARLSTCGVVSCLCSPADMSVLVAFERLLRALAVAPDVKCQLETVSEPDLSVKYELRRVVSRRRRNRCRPVETVLRRSVRMVAARHVDHELAVQTAQLQAFTVSSSSSLSHSNS
eukprot:2246415-Rhodomonas_salina.2